MVHNSYGKSRVRLTKVTRGQVHSIVELSLDVQLEGDFESCFTHGDNSAVIATDSMKNTIYVLAAKNQWNAPEEFASLLAKHFVESYPQVHFADICIEQEPWQRIQLDGQPHPHAFSHGGSERRTARVRQIGTESEIIAGIDGLCVVKTTRSAFSGFVRDSYTTLPETRDRILGTTISAEWTYTQQRENFNQIYDVVRNTILQVFAEHMSESVQQTMYQIGQAVLDKCQSIGQMTITMPNQHRIPFDLRPFNLENRNEIFIATSEPYGLISATIERSLS